MRPLEILGVSILAVDLAVGGISLFLSNPFQGSWTMLLGAMLLILLVGTVMLLADWTWRPSSAVKHPQQTSVTPAAQVCVYCGTRNPEEAFYCLKCGKRHAQSI